jgi:foldase protein PrsA
MKRHGGWVFVAAVALAGAALAAPTPKLPGGNDVVALVNSEPITRESLIKRLLSYYGERTLDAMVNQAIVRQAAQRQKLAVTDEEVDKRVVQIKGMFRTPEMYQQMLHESGLTEPQHREQVRFTMLSERIVAKVDPVKDADLEQARAAILVVGSDEEGTALLRTIKGGADFAQVAREKSRDKRTGQAGGDLGFFLRVDLPDVWKLAAPLKPGEVTGPVKLGKNTVLLKLVERRAAATLNPQERERFTVRVLNFKINEWLDRSRRQAKVVRPSPVTLP